jgi:excisionase family DNA binding protein
LSTRDVALLFQVSERTVTNWADKKKLAALRTPGGHRRYPADGVRTLFRDAHRT